MITAFTQDTLGMVCFALLVAFFTRIPDLWSIFSTINRKRSFVLEHGKDHVIRIKQAVSDGTLWHMMGGKKGEVETDIFESEPENVHMFLGRPAIDVYKAYTTGVPPEVLVMIKHIKNEFGLHSYDEINEFMSNITNIHEVIQDEIEAKLSDETLQSDMYAELEKMLALPANEKKILKEMKSMKTDKPEETPTFKAIYDIKNTAIYKKTARYKTTDAYMELPPDFQVSYTKARPLIRSGLVPLPLEVINLGDVQDFLVYNHNPVYYAVDKKNAIADTKLEMIAQMPQGGKAGGGLGGLLSGELGFKQIAVAVLLGYLALTVLGAMSGNSGQAAQAASQGATATTTFIPT